ncbi:hypothetical protein ACG2OD_09935 [Streptomyces sp. PDY-4]|uniref:hypothetical protein n=1 Tax=Streptomyces TaxID=1883 RepID=UPI00114F481E|nr:hypothetical protein [Streptomyces sp. SLBN-134]TQL19783.1 hypothetical protein FBY37_1715 [Streptomyces sp. SLBN-134]
MGVFARLFRRSKATEETRTAEARAGEAAAGPAEEAAGAARPEGTDEAPEGAGPAGKGSGEVTVTDTLEIPKQQSAESAGSETGEGART